MLYSGTILSLSRTERTISRVPMRNLRKLWPCAPAASRRSYPSRCYVLHRAPRLNAPAYAGQHQHVLRAAVGHEELAHEVVERPLQRRPRRRAEGAERTEHVLK
jgi:hypothetical protein